MKKILTLAFVLSAAFSFSACRLTMAVVDIASSMPSPVTVSVIGGSVQIISAGNSDTKVSSSEAMLVMPEQSLALNTKKNIKDNAENAFIYSHDKSSSQVCSAGEVYTYDLNRGASVTLMVRALNEDALVEVSGPGKEVQRVEILQSDIIGKSFYFSRRNK